jgi:hypothetical protein
MMVEICGWIFLAQSGTLRLLCHRLPSRHDFTGEALGSHNIIRTHRPGSAALLQLLYQRSRLVSPGQLRPGHYSPGDSAGSRSIRIPREVLAGYSGIAEIKFRYSDADSPAHLGLYLDPRIVALGLKSLTLRTE